MANPQAEDGHTDIAHGVLEALIIAKLTGPQWSVAMMVLRKTWGWKKKADHISLSQFSTSTGLPRRTISRSLSSLERSKILVPQRSPGRMTEWSFNKDWETWELGTQMTPVSNLTRDISGKSLGTQVATTKETLTKENKRAAKKADPRFQPLKKFFHEQYEEIRGTKLVTDGSDYAGLRKLLKQTPEFSLEDLQQAAIRYLRSDKPFHVDQGHPLRYWANNINPFLPGRKQWTDDLKEVN